MCVIPAMSLLFSPRVTEDSFDYPELRETPTQTQDVYNKYTPTHRQGVRVKKAGRTMPPLFRWHQNKPTRLDTEQTLSGDIIYCISTLGYIPLSKVV